MSDPLSIFAHSQNYVPTNFCLFSAVLLNIKRVAASFFLPYTTANKTFLLLLRPLLFDYHYSDYYYSHYPRLHKHWLAIAGAAKESAYSTTTHSFVSSLSRRGQRPLGQTRYPVFTLALHLNCLGWSGCTRWENLTSGEVLASDCWDHQTRMCHIPHQTPNISLTMTTRMSDYQVRRTANAFLSFRRRQILRTSGSPPPVITPSSS